MYEYLLCFKGQINFAIIIMILISFLTNAVKKENNGTQTIVKGSCIKKETYGYPRKVFTS